MIKFKLDENLPIEAASDLTAAGYDALTVPGQNLGGKTDSEIAAACCAEARVLITLDLDFADIRHYPPADYSGIVVLRLARLDKHSVISAIRRLIPVLNQEPLVSKLWIVDETRVRIRD